MKVIDTSVENGTSGVRIVRGESSGAKCTAGVYGRLS